MHHQYGVALPITFIFLLIVTTTLVLQFQRHSFLMQLNHMATEKQESFYNAEVGIQIVENLISEATSPNHLVELLMPLNISLDHLVPLVHHDYSDASFWISVPVYAAFPAAQVVIEIYYNETTFLNLSISSDTELWNYRITSRGLSHNNRYIIQNYGDSALLPDALSESIIQTLYKKEYIY